MFDGTFLSSHKDISLAIEMEYINYQSIIGSDILYSTFRFKFNFF